MLLAFCDMFRCQENSQDRRLRPYHVHISMVAKSQTSRLRTGGMLVPAQCTV